MKYWQPTLAILAALSASVALAEDFRTVNGKEYKDATVSSVEADGLVLVLKTKSGISRVYFSELPKEVQERFHYEAPGSVLHAVEQPVPVTDNSARTKQDAAIREEPKPEKQLDDAQFDDLRRRDWYEDLKEQEKLKNRSDYMLSLMDSMEAKVSDCPKCVDTYRRMLTEERKAHRENHRALSAIAAQIMATKSYEDCKKLKAIENQVLAAMEAQKIHDWNDVEELRFRVSERDAASLENWQRDQ